MHPGPSGCQPIYEYSSAQRKGLSRSSYPYSASDNGAFYRDQNNAFKVDSSQNSSTLRQLVAVKHAYLKLLYFVVLFVTSTNCDCQECCYIIFCKKKFVLYLCCDCRATK